MLDPELTNVTIFGQEYSVRGGSDPEYVRRVAALVDARMRDVARTAHQVSSVRVAILAAMNIADELLRSQQPDGNQALQARARRLAESLEQALSAAADDVGKGGEALPDS